MRKFIKKGLVSILFALACVCVFAGCKIGDTLDDYINDYNLDAQVTYYANEGKFNNNQKIKTLYLTSGSKALDIGVVVNSVGTPINVSYNDDYEFGGWFYAEKDADGNVVYADEDKQTVVLSDQAVDFDDPLEKDEQWVIGAKWLKLEVLEVYLVYDGLSGLAVGETTVQNGELLREYSFNGGMQIAEPTLAPVDTETVCTFTTFYTDAACTQKAVWPIERKGTGENPKIYAKYLEGTWKILDAYGDLYDLFVPNASGNYYLLNDIDGKGNQFAPITNFSGKILGNGFTISNLKVASTIGGQGTNLAAMFGEIKASAVMKDVTFEDVTVNFTMKSGKAAYLYFFSKNVESGATFENVVIKGGALKVDISTGDTIYNMNIVDSAVSGTDYTRTNYVFGSYDATQGDNVYATDDAFLAAFTGISFAKDEENGNQPIAPQLQVPKLDKAN